MTEEITKQKEKLLQALMRKNDALEIIKASDKAILEASVALNAISFIEKKNADTSG